MQNRNPSNRIVLYEILGFGLVILLSWLDELARLPLRLFGDNYKWNYPEAIMETFIVLGVAIPIILTTRRLLLRLHYLEGFLHVCAWCRKVNHDGHWLTLESYFDQRFETKTSHGMCPECFAKVSQEAEGKSPAADARRN